MNKRYFKNKFLLLWEFVILIVIPPHVNNKRRFFLKTPFHFITVITFNVLTFVGYPFISGNIKGTSCIKYFVFEDNFIPTK